MNRTYVQSTDLLSVGYDEGTLEIEFHSGGIYQYYGVPPYVHQNLMNAQSKGKYFSANIRGKYTEKKL